MTNKPTTIWGYGEDNLANVRSTCLYVATKLGDFLEDIVIVGGLVPSLLVDRGEVIWGMEAHAGTLDIDIGLALAILDEERYRSLGERLKEAGFAPDTNENGNPTHQRWKSDFGQSVAIDFLIPPTGKGDIPGRLKHILPNFAAFVIPGLHMAFCDRQKVALQGHTPSGEEAQREVWVCGPGAFTVLKALAFENRGSNKDAYDMAYVWRGLGVERTAECLGLFLGDPYVQQALRVIRDNFSTHDSIGPRRTAEFLTEGTDDEIQADTVGLATSLLTLLSRDE